MLELNYLEIEMKRIEIYLLVFGLSFIASGFISYLYHENIRLNKRVQEIYQDADSSTRHLNQALLDCKAHKGKK